MIPAPLSPPALVQVARAVPPAAALPRQAARGGGRLALVNQQSTPLDDHAHWRAEDLAAVFSELVADASYD